VFRGLVAALWVLSLTAGCGSTSTDGGTSSLDSTSSADASATEDAAPSGPGGVTYHEVIRPLIAADCVSCHVDGGGGPFPLTYDEGEWADGSPWWAASAVAAVSEGSMPPWQPDTDCRPIVHARVLSPDDIAAFEAWQAEGFVEGDPATYAAPATTNTVDLGEPDLRLDAGEPYTANPLYPDDYRCFLVGEPLTEDLYITAATIEPGVASIVHHVLLYAIVPEAIGQIEALDAQDDGLGYTCFGGPGASSSQTVAAWAPGGTPFVTPPGSAIRVEAGSRIVMQIHYNLAYLAPDAAVPPDLSATLLWTLEAGEELNKLVRILPYANVGISLDAGEPEIVEDRDFDVPFSGTVIGAVPHMHMLGTSIRSELISAEGESTCVVDIPEWDFNWQQFYLFDEAHHIPVEIGDVHRMSCTYDNSLENQPVINGEQLAPRHVEWGDGSFDEMCLTYLVVMTPYEIDGGVCNGVAQCSVNCEPGDFNCFFGCAIAPGTACIQCMGSLLVECGAHECPPETSAVVTCFQEQCGDDPLACVTETCIEEFNALHACLHEPMHEGACNEEFAACDLVY
jgi:hypothetical protein